MSVSQNSIKFRLSRLASSLTLSLSQTCGLDGFPERTFYGEAFASVAFSFQKLPSSTINQALDAAHKRWNTSEQTQQHLEFLWYAQDLLEQTGFLSHNPLKLPHVFSHTIRAKPTNWILLRARYFLQHGTWWQKYLWKQLAKRIIQSNWNGTLILDRGIGAMIRRDKQPNYLSDQYMAFILIILTELHDITHDPFFKTWFYKGLNTLILKWRSQDFRLTQGRGANQLFGHISLIYALSWATSQNQTDATWNNDLDQAILHLEHNQLQDGTFPLILEFEDDRSHWESYNNLYDYLGFTASLLHRATLILPETDSLHER